MVLNAVLENSETQNYDDEQIKYLAAFFADKSYQSLEGATLTYLQDEWIVIKEQHNNDETTPSGFDGAVYLNPKTGQFVVTFRGTEFTADERGYRDAIKNDVLGFGYNKEPKQYEDAENLLKEAIGILNDGYWENTTTGERYTFSSDPSNLIITGHSLGGGLAQLIGAQEEYKQYQVHTFNAIGVAQMVDNLSKDGFNFSGDYSNITNHVISRDFVSTIYDHLGEVIVYKPSLENRLTAGDYIPLNFSKKGNGIVGTIYPALGKAFKGHTITNFTDSSSFEIEDSSFTFQSLCSILRKLKGGVVTEEVLAPLLTPIIEIGFGGAYIGNKLYNKIFRTGTPTGGASDIEGSSSTLVGGVSMVDTPEEYDEICQVFVDNDFSFVGKIIDAEGNITFYVDDTANSNSALNEIVTNNQYFEIYNNGQELIYNKNQDADTLYVYQDDATVSQIRSQIINLKDLHIAILNQEANGNSTIIGDQKGNLLEGNIGRNIIYGGVNSDQLNGSQGNDSLFGGLGKDEYIFVTGDGNDIIQDSDEEITSVKDIVYTVKDGRVNINSHILTGGTYNESTGQYISDDIGITYTWSGINGTDLLISYGTGDSVTVKKFNNGDLGILFDSSKSTDIEDIANQLKRNKQVQADIFVDNKDYTTKDVSLTYVDESGVEHTIVDCEKTSKILNGYGEILSGATLDSSGTYIILDSTSNKIVLKQKPVDYSSLVNEITNLTNGIEVKREDLAIQGSNIYIPTSSKDGSPTMEDIHYQYTTKPSGGGFLAGLFTVVQLAACLISQQWWAAAFVALNSGFAGEKVAKISSIVDSVISVVNLAKAGIKGVNAIVSGKYANGHMLGGAAGIQSDTRLPSIWINDDGSVISNGKYIPVTQRAIDTSDKFSKTLISGISYDYFKSSAIQTTSQFSSFNLNEFNTASMFTVFDLIVNKNTNPNIDYSQNYSVNASTGSISGIVNIETSNLLEADVSTPEGTPQFEISIDRGCPLILDLGDDGIDTLDIDETNIYFDTQNTGFATKTGWVSKDEGFLVVDKNNDGKITHQNELFGSEDTTGFEDLKKYDSNKDGVINSLDSNFKDLKVWQDLNENGITDEGELKTLEQMGINSINLTPVELNIEQNQNTITGMSSYTTTDGRTHNIYNVNFAFNKIYTQYEGTYELSIDVLDMPWLRGYGQVKDLQLKMSEDETFKAYVKELSAIDDAKMLYDKMDEFLAKWIGCDDIDSNAEVNGINSRELEILNKYLNLGLEGEISADKKVFFDHAYSGLKNKIYANFIAQTEIGDAFEINYDYKTDSMLYNDNTYEKLITNLPHQKNFYASYIIASVLNDAGSLDGNKLAYTITQKGFGASLISYLNSGFQILDSGDIELLTPNTPMYVIGTSGDDTITGTDNADIIYGMDGDDILIGGAGDDYLSGGNGNDILIGGDGNDTMDGGAGDDQLDGGYGNDIYIYDGQGKDTVLDERWVKIARQEWYQSGWWIFKRWKYKWVYQDKLVDAGNDTVIFGDDVQEKDVQISKKGNDLIFELKNTDNKLTIKNWYSSSEQRVEKFVFADGFVINHAQIMNSITDKAGTDSIVGTNKDNYILSVSGNDTINAKKGDDAIINYEGDTTYIFNKGDGNDIIMDYQGNDKIKFGSSIAVKDVTYLRNNKDLIISINNMSDTITILNWFTSDDNKIEKIEFVDGTIHTPVDISDSLSSTIATGYDDVIIGNDQDNILDGLAGNDYIESRGGNDTLIGGLGKDIMKGGLGDDIYYVDNLGDQVIENEGEGIDTINTTVSYELSDNVENLNLIGNGNINGRGNELDNVITGNDGNNIIDGCGGTNTLQGGKGDDTYIINESTANDKIIEKDGEGTDTVQSSITYILAKNVENLVLTGEDDINGTGNSGDNYITGNKGNNILSGDSGNDTLYGGEGGKDTLKGGTGNDTYIVNSSNVTVVENANEGTDTVISNIDYTLSANVENLKLEGSSALKGTGNALNNVITGNNQNNTFVGGKGNDTLKGGSGADTYIFNKGDGQDIIEENSPNSNAVDKIVFGKGITKNDVTFTRKGYDLIVAIKNTTDKITIKNSNLAFGSRIERFEFSDGSYIDGAGLYTLAASTSKPNLYSDVSYLNVNSKASAIDREYYDEGGLKSETFYSTNAKISSKNFYDESGVLIQQNTYNSNGLLTNEVKYKSKDVIETQTEYTYDSSKRVSQIKNYNGKVLDTTETYSYNENGTKSQIVVYNKGTSKILNKIKFTYDTSGNLTEQKKYQSDTSTVLEEISYTYDSAGNVTSQLTKVRYNQPNPTTSGMKYTSKLRNDEEIRYTYKNGKLTNVTTTVAYSENIKKTVGSVTYNYNDYLHTHKKSEVSYTYDSAGNITRKLTQIGYNKPSATSSGLKYTWSLRNDEDICYTYKNGKLTNITTTAAYSENVSKEVGGVTYKYKDYLHTHKTSEITYVYDDIGNIKTIKEEVGYNKANPTTSGMEYKWAYRTKRKEEYTYNSNHQLSEVKKYSSNADLVSKQVGSKKYSYYEYNTRISEEIIYKYNSDCQITDEKIYRYSYNDKNVWTSSLAEQRTYKYDTEGRLILVQHYNNNKLVESIKYEYELDSNGYLTKQTIYKGVISNNKVSSYKKYSEVSINSYYNKLVGDISNNTLNGSNQSDNIQGGAGNDTLYGHSGNDILNGGTEADLLVGGQGDDIYVVDNAKDVIVEHANQGNDTVQTTLNNYTLGTNLENLTLLGTGNLTGKGNAYDNILKGNSGNNILYGYAGNDILDGGKGNDTMYGDTGDDIYYIDTTGDKVIEKTNEGIDTVVSTIDYTLEANVENLYLDTGAIRGTGNNLNNKIVGNDANNILNGKSGKNTLLGGKGDDIYIINASNSADVITEYMDEGEDTIQSSITYSLEYIYNVENLTLTGSDNINGFGNSLNNCITGNNGDNVLQGGEGNDTLKGGLGDDIYIFNLGDGEDTIYESGSTYEYVDTLQFGEGITFEDVKFTKIGNDLVVSITGTNDKVIIKDSNINLDSRIEKFVFADGTVVDGRKFYELSTSLEYTSASSEFTFGMNSISSSLRRKNDKYDGTESELYLDVNGNVIEKYAYTYFMSQKQIIHMDGTEEYEYIYNNEGYLSNSFTYDESGRVLTSKDGSYTCYYSYSNNDDGMMIQAEDRYFDDRIYTSTTLRYYDSNNLIMKEETYKDEKLEKTKTYTYDDSNTLISNLVTQIIYNEDGTTKTQNISKTEYTYHANGKLKLENETGWYPVPNTNKYRAYSARQRLFTYNAVGQISSEVYFKGSYNEITDEAGNITLDYVRYKDVITYSYNNMNKLSTMKTQSGYYDKAVSAWDLHISEQRTYEYDEETGLLIKETVESGSLVNDVWIAKISDVYTYEYNEAGMLTKKIGTDYSLDSAGREWQVIEHTYDEETGRLILTNVYIQNKLSQSTKYEYEYNDNGILLAQKIYKGIISSENTISSYELFKELSINSYNNVLNGDSNNNILYGGSQDDYLLGGAGSDILYGGLGDDILDGGANRDVMIGGKGDDTYYVGNITDKIIELENEGIDTVISEVTYTLPDNVENLTIAETGTSTNGIGNDMDNVLTGSSSDNILTGNGGNDTLLGGKGDDKLYGGTGNDTYIFSQGDGQDLIIDTAGDDDNILFNENVTKDNFAIYKDGNDLIIDYGINTGQDIITIKNQLLSNTIEKIELADGSYISNEDVNQIIQNMTAYAQNNAIEFSGIETVKNNADLMNIVASSWHN